jgi:hypothetical protein
VTDFPVGATFNGGRYRVERHLQGNGLQQLFLGKDEHDGNALLVSYDKRPKKMSIEEFADATSIKLSGVFDLAFAGPPDNPAHKAYWGVIERVTTGSWLPSVLGEQPAEAAADPIPRRLVGFDPIRALPNALALGRSAGHILMECVDRGQVLARVRPESMWVASSSELRVTGLSQRSELAFELSYADMATWPVFDRYYYAPEVERGTATDRSLVFCLSIMIAEWATGCFPFRSKVHRNGPLKGEHVQLDLPARLAELLSSGMRVDPEQRPSLRQFLAELAA